MHDFARYPLLASFLLDNCKAIHLINVAIGGFLVQIMPALGWLR